MLRTSLSIAAFCALTAIAANTLAERALAPKKVEVDISFLSRHFGAKKQALAPIEPKTPRSKQFKQRVESEEKIELVELSESDFIPGENNGEAVRDANAGIAGTANADININKAEIHYAEISKDIVIEEQLATPALERFKEENPIAKGGLSINGAWPVKLAGFKKGAKIKPSALAANYKPVKIDVQMKAAPVKVAAVPQENEIKKTETRNNDKSLPTEQDRISTGLAATEKSSSAKNIDVAPGTTDKDLGETAEMVFFDYSKPEAKKPNPGKSAIPTPVTANSPADQEVAKSAQAKQARAKQSPPSNQELVREMMKKMGQGLKGGGAASIAAADSKTNVQADEKGLKGKQKSEADVKKFAAPFEKKMNSQNHRSVYRLTTQSVSLKGVNHGRARDFEVRFGDDIDDIARSDAEGVVLMENLLNSEYAVRRGTILSGGHYPLSTDFVLEAQEVNLRVPLITEESFNWMLDNQGLRGLGGHVLIELDQLTEDAELDLDTRYEKKLYLDRRMRVVKREESDFAFILFVGVEPGNKIISFKTYKNETASKIIHVTQDEIYFDFNFYAEVEDDEFELYEEHLLSKETGLLSVDEGEIIDLGFNTDFVKKTVNRMSAKRALYAVGSRKYYELNHLNESVYVGRWSSDYVDVPSESYMRFAISNFQGYALENSCLVQINLEKQAAELYYNGRSFRGHMRIIPRILDTDGVFYKDLSHQSKRVFLLGEEQGTISVKIKYADNSVDYLQTFCSKSNYVVEQL